MSRRRGHAGRVDANQTEIVAGLRAFGWSVQPLAAVGDGCPDLLVGARRHNILLEVKDGAKKPSARQLTEDQVRWHDAWRGRVYVVHNLEGAIAAVNQQCAGVVP